MSSSISHPQPKIFPKLFIGSAAKAFEQFIKRNNFDYTINYIQSREDLISLIDVYSKYKNYSLPVIISDISYLNNADQSLLLKFMEDSKLKIIILASRDNVLGTIISRVKEFRKYYSELKNVSFMKCSAARENLSNETFDDLSNEDKLIIYNKYNPVLAYTDSLVKKFPFNDKQKLLNILEFSDER